MQVKMVQIDEIKIDNPYLRLDTDIEKLIESIKTVGLISPLVVNKEMELIAGGRRYTALIELGEKKVPVIIRDEDHRLQELISIDENLIRLALDDITFEESLSRGKKLYEELYPETVGVESATNEESENENSEQKNFIAHVAHKTGMSEKSIKKAIERDQCSSARVKDARRNGEVNVSQTNHLMKLSKGDQNEILSYVVEQPSAKTKDIIHKVLHDGIDRAKRDVEKMVMLPREFEDLSKGAKKLSKLIDKIEKTKLDYRGDERDTIFKQLDELHDRLGAFLANN